METKSKVLWAIKPQKTGLRRSFGAWHFTLETDYMPYIAVDDGVMIKAGFGGF